MNQALIDLIEKKKTQSQPDSNIDWDDRRDKYVQAVNFLYNQIEGFLANPIKNNAVVLERRSKKLSENYIGTYSVDDLILLIGSEQIRFSPQGRNIAGAVGRVDVVGERDEATLIAQPGPRWQYLKTRQPTLRAIPFDESALAEVLQRVTRE